MDVMPPPAGVAVECESGEPVRSGVTLSRRGRGVKTGSSGAGVAGNDALGDPRRDVGARSVGASPGVIMETATGAVI